jgi:hypothetical protein
MSLGHHIHTASHLASHHIIKSFEHNPVGTGLGLAAGVAVVVVAAPVAAAATVAAGATAATATAVSTIFGIGTVAGCSLGGGAVETAIKHRQGNH